MINSYIAKKDLDSEMTVVRNEFEMGENDPASILEERVLSTAFLWHNYGKSTIGARADLENVPIDRLQAFYRTFYQPDNAVLLVAGKFDEAKTLDARQPDLRQDPEARRARCRPSTRSSRRRTASAASRCSAWATSRRSPRRTTCRRARIPSSGAVNLLEQVLTDTPSGRLYKALVETKKATSVGGYFMELHDPGLRDLQRRGPPGPGRRTRRRRRSSRRSTPPRGATPITKEEVDRARATLLKNIDLMLNSADRVGLNLSEYIGQGDWRLFFLNRDRIRERDGRGRAEGGRGVPEALQPHRSASSSRRPSPTAPRSRRRCAAAAAVKDYKGDAAIAAGEAFDPVAGQHRSAHEALGASERH